MYICAKMSPYIITTFAFVFLLKEASSYCPEAFERHGHSCYKVFALKASWIEAKKYCGIFGGDLATIESEAEEMVIEGILQRTHGSVNQEIYWVDGSDILIEGEWRWMKDRGNSIPITGFTHWAPGQPDNAQSIENCLEIRYDFKLFWNDNPCDTKESFICEASVDWDSEQGSLLIG